MRTVRFIKDYMEYKKGDIVRIDIELAKKLLIEKIVVVTF